MNSLICGMAGFRASASPMFTVSFNRSIMPVRVLDCASIAPAYFDSIPSMIIGMAVAASSS